MFVYIWKDPHGVPFYVGLTKRVGRTNPRNNGGRNWLTRQRIAEIGVDNIVVELRHVESAEAGSKLEKSLIALFGRIQMSTGTLTNLREGGEGTYSPTPEHREKLREAMRNPNHPVRSKAAREAHLARMRSPDVMAKFLGDANPAKKPETRAKLKAKWEDPEYQARQAESRTGKKRNLSENTKQVLRENLANNPSMVGWSERNGKDTEFDAKRIAGIKAAQPKRREKMADPEALAQRKARLKATLNSEEYKAKRAQWDTPEYRAKLSAAKREYWAKKREQS